MEDVNTEDEEEALINDALAKFQTVDEGPLTETAVNGDSSSKAIEDPDNMELERKYHKNSWKYRSPWMKRARLFHENPTFTKQDLIIPHFKELTNDDDIIQLEESDYVPIQDG